jgi:hypothetical protein
VLLTKLSDNAFKITRKIGAGQGSGQQIFIDGAINAGRSAAMAGMAIGIE